MIVMSRLISSRQMVDVALGVLNLAAGGTFAPEFRDDNLGLRRATMSCLTDQNEAAAL